MPRLIEICTVKRTAKKDFLDHTDVCVEVKTVAEQNELSDEIWSAIRKVLKKREKHECPECGEFFIKLTKTGKCKECQAFEMNDDFILVKQPA